MLAIQNCWTSSSCLWWSCKIISTKIFIRLLANVCKYWSVLGFWYIRDTSVRYYVAVESCIWIVVIHKHSLQRGTIVCCDAEEMETKQWFIMCMLTCVLQLFLLQRILFYLCFLTVFCFPVLWSRFAWHQLFKQTVLNLHRHVNDMWTSNLMKFRSCSTLRQQLSSMDCILPHTFVYFW